MAVEENTNWGQSVAGVVRRGDDVLLVRHTYGAGKGKLIVPGGYVHIGETPEAAAAREVLEETSVRAEPERLIGVRFNQRDWYMVFLMRDLGGEPVSDGDENSEAVFCNIYEMMESPECPGLTQEILRSVAENEEGGLIPRSFHTGNERGEATFYTLPAKRPF